MPDSWSSNHFCNNWPGRLSSSLLTRDFRQAEVSVYPFTFSLMLIQGDLYCISQRLCLDIYVLINRFAPVGLYTVFSFSVTVMAKNSSWPSRKSTYLAPGGPQKRDSPAAYWRHYRECLKQYYPEKYQMAKIKNALRMRRRRREAKEKQARLSREKELT